MSMVRSRQLGNLQDFEMNSNKQRGLLIFKLAIPSHSLSQDIIALFTHCDWQAAAGVFRLGLERYGDREPSLLAAYVNFLIGGAPAK